MTRKRDTETDPLLTSSEVARLCRVDLRTINRWTREGRLPVALRTLGGRARYRESEIRQALAMPGKEQ